MECGKERMKGGSESGMKGGRMECKEGMKGSRVEWKKRD